MSSRTDRELLELAAKAAGMAGWRYTGNGLSKMIDPSRPESTGSIGPDWNPLADDGDALRLAVKCKVLRCHMDLFHKFYEEFVAAGLDEGAATRRAIVCAVVEIGGAA